MNGEREDYVIPETLNEASELLQKKGALLVSGGTSLKFRNLDRYEIMVDISRAVSPAIERDGDVMILGAGARISDLLKNDEFKSINCGILYETARNIGTTPIRNQVTVGGNISMVYPWSDLPVSLLALNAKISTNKREKDRAYPAVDFFAKNPSKLLEKGEIVTEIEIPIYDQDYHFVFKTLNRTMGDFTALNVAVGYVRGDILKDLRISVSGITSLPQRLHELEWELEGKTLKDDIVGESIDRHISNFKTHDIRYSQEYLEKVLKVYLKRLLRGEGCPEVVK